MKRAIQIVVVAFAVGLAALGVAIWQQVPERLASGLACTDEDHHFARRLAKDPLLTTAPTGGFTPFYTPAHAFQPCEGNGDQDYYGGAVRAWRHPARRPAEADIERHYQEVAAANGWQLSRHSSGRLCGQKAVDGTAVTFLLHLVPGQPDDIGFDAELMYQRLGSTEYRCADGPAPRG